MTLQEYAKYSATPKIESIHELVRLVGPDILEIYRLILHDVGIKGIGKQDLNGFKNLVHLNLSANNIIRIEGLNHLSATLQSLDLSCNRITKIPSGCFKDLIHLKKLYLAFNHISSLESLTQMHGTRYQLQLLDLRNNEIKDIKNIQFLKGLVNLKVLMFQNADKTAQNPICSNFYKEVKGQHRNWRMYIKHQLPLLEQLDQIALYSESERRTGQSVEDGDHINSDAIAIDNDLINTYPELRALLEESNSENSDSEDGYASETHGSDKEYEALLRTEERLTREEQKKPEEIEFIWNGDHPSHEVRKTIVNTDENVSRGQDGRMIQLHKKGRQMSEHRQQSSNRSTDSIDRLQDLSKDDSLNLEHPSEIRQKAEQKNFFQDNVPPSISTHSPPTQPKLRKGESKAIVKSGAFNHQFKKIGSFINKYQRKQESHDFEDDLSTSDSTENVSKQRRKRKNMSTAHDLSEVDSTTSYPSFPDVNDNLRSLPSVLSLSEYQHIEHFPNEEKEKLIQMVAELSETLGNTNAYIQQREIELASEASRRRTLEDRVKTIQEKCNTYRQKNKSFAKIVRDLKSTLNSNYSYQQQLESTIKQTSEEINNIRSENEKLSFRISELEEENKKYSMTVANNDSTSHSMQLLEEKLKSLEEDRNTIVKNNETLLHEQERYQKEIIALKYKLRKQEEHHKRSLQQQAKLISKQIGQCEDGQQQELDRLKSFYENEILQLKEKQKVDVQMIEDTHKKNYSELEAKHQLELNELRTQTSKEIEQLKESHNQEVKDYEKKIQNLFDTEVKTRDSTIQQLENEQSQLQDKINNAEVDIQTYISQVKELKEYLKRYVNQEVHARATEDSLKEIIQNQAEKMKEIAGKYKQQQAESRKRENTLAVEAETWQQKYETDVCALQSKMKMLTINMATKDKIIEKLEKKISSHSNDHEQIASEYKLKLDEQVKIVEKLEQDIQRLNNENNISKHIIEDRDDTIQSQKKEIETLKDQNKKVERDLNYYADKVDRLKDDQIIFEEDIEKKNKVIEELQLEMDEMSRLLSKQAQKIQKLTAQFESAQNENSALRTDLKTLKEERQNLQSASEKLHDEIKEIEKKMKQSEEDFQKFHQVEIGQYKQELVNKQTQIKLLVEKVKKDNEEKEGLKLKLKKLRQAFEDD